MCASMQAFELSKMQAYAAKTAEIAAFEKSLSKANASKYKVSHSKRAKKHKEEEEEEPTAKKMKKIKLPDHRNGTSCGGL